MLILALILVLASGLTHAVWNLFTKKSKNRVVFLWSIHLMSFVLLMPFFIQELIRVPLSFQVYGLMLVSIAIQGCYIWLLSRSYAHGEMSQVYPFMRGTSALLIPVSSILLFREDITWMGCIGLGVIVAGLFALSGAANVRAWRQFNRGSLHYAAGVGLCITGYTLIDKIILSTGFSPVALIQLSNIGYTLVLAIPALSSFSQAKTEWRTNWRTMLIGSIFSPGSYVLFLFAMQVAPLSHIAPIREISTVFGTLFGVVILKEQQGFKRICVSICITLGIMTISLWG